MNSKFRKINASNRIEAVTEARKLCTCLRMSLEGVRWYESTPAGRVERTLAWAELADQPRTEPVANFDRP
jgi:hypothetical protein